MNDRELLTGRPYGGTAIFFRKTLNCTITNCETDCDRLCATLVDFKKITVFFYVSICHAILGVIVIALTL